MGAPRGAARRRAKAASPGARYSISDQGVRNNYTSSPGRNGFPPPAAEKRAPSAYRCPNCGKVNTVRQGREAPLFACFKCTEEELADAVGVTVSELIEDPWTALAPFEVFRAGARPRRVAEVPSAAKVAGWAAALQANAVGLDLLRRERGIGLATVRQFKIGWDHVREGFTLPIYDERGELVNRSLRAPKGRKLRGTQLSKHRLTGRTAENGGLPLYPLPLPDGPLLLTEGEWDALIARQAGLPAVTGLLGKQWNAAWDRFIVGRRVAVAYDVGAEGDAARTVERLREAGAQEAWHVPLGLPNEGDDLTNWWVTYGRTAEELLELIRRARRRAA